MNLYPTASTTGLRVSEAKDLAREWVLSQAPEIPGFEGALFGGSINWWPDDAFWPASSDVDIWILQGGVETPADHEKVLMNGLILEPLHMKSETFHNVEQVLANAYKAPHLSRPCIISDPTGTLTPLQQAVAKDFAKPQWVRKRVEELKRGAERHLFFAGLETPEAPAQFHNINWSMRNIAAVVPTADLTLPTMRRCLVLSKQILECTGLPEMHERILGLLGCREMTLVMAQRCQDRMVEAFDRAVDIGPGTPFWGTFNLNADARPISVGGGQEMIDAGYPREAIFFIAFIHGLAQTRIQKDGTEEEKPYYDGLFRELLGELGLNTHADFVRRATEGERLLQDVVKACQVPD